MTIDKRYDCLTALPGIDASLEKQNVPGNSGTFRSNHVVLVIQTINARGFHQKEFPGCYLPDYSPDSPDSFYSGSLRSCGSVR